MIDAPQIIQTEEQLTAVIHLAVPRTEIVNVMAPAIAEILSALDAQGIAPTGPCFSYHLRRPADSFDFEAGFPVSKPVSPTGRVKSSKLPAAKVARTIYRGAYEGLAEAWGEFCAWLDTEGLSPQNSLWECYTTGPESSPEPDTWCTELNRQLT